MSSRSGLERVLGGIVGVVLGAIMSVALLFMVAEASWLLAIPPAVCGVIGFTSGDRGIHAIARVTGLFG